MRTLSETLGVLVALALLGALGFGAYSVLHWMIGLYSSLNPEVGAVTVILSAVALLAAMIVSRGGTGTAKREIALRAQSERATIYIEMLDSWERRIRLQSIPGSGTPKSLDDLNRPLALRLALYGSPAVLKAHQRLNELTKDGVPDGDAGRVALVDAVLAVRYELGSGNAGATRDLLAEILFTESFAGSKAGTSAADSSSEDAAAGETGKP